MYFKISGLIAVVLLISVAIWQYSSPSGFESDPLENAELASVDYATAKPSKSTEVGDAGQPQSDLESSDTARIGAGDNGLARVKTVSPPELHRKPVPGGFRLDENEAIAGLVRDIQSGQSPASQSSLILPEAFDEESYRADPEAYLKQVRPGRVFQSAQPGPDVKRIAAKSRALHRVLQGETTLLEVMMEPGMPVTFYTQQVGEFDNRLSTISVKAGEDGIARAHFKATNAAGMVNVIAASPVHSEQVEFVIRVLVPEVAGN